MGNYSSGSENDGEKVLVRKHEKRQIESRKMQGVGGE